MSVPSVTFFKNCKGCGVSYPATTQFFHPRKIARFGLRGRCRACYNVQRRQHRNTNLAQVSASKRQYVSSNRLKINEQARRRRQLPHVKEYERVYRRSYVLRNRMQRTAATQRYRALKASAAGNHTGEELREMRKDQRGACAYCEVDITSKYEVDHMIPLSRGGANDWSNLALACKSCNASKGGRTAEEYWEVLCRT